MTTDEYSAWETVWTVWKMRDEELVSTGKGFATEAEAVAVADGLSHTETRVVSSRRVVDTPLPDHLAVGWGTIETGFHEYAADLTRQELGRGGEGPTSFPPEFADWAVGMKAAREWLTAHDARVRRDAAREALDGLTANMTQIANGSPDPLTRTSATITARLAGDYKLNVYPEETP